MKISSQNVSRGLDAVPQPKQANNEVRVKGRVQKPESRNSSARGVPPVYGRENLGEKINVKGGGWEPPLWTNSVTWVSEAFPYRHAQYTVHSVHMERAETERGWLSWWPPVRSRPASGQVLE